MTSATNEETPCRCIGAAACWTATLSSKILTCFGRVRATVGRL